MKLLCANEWKVQGYDNTNKAWKFLKDSMKDWELCIVPNAKLIDRNNKVLRYYNSDGSSRVKSLEPKFK